MIYTIPSFHVPTATVMPLERRPRLMEIARESNLTVVEDNCYYDLYFDEPPPTLLSLDDSGLVVQSDSFSKIIAPGLRLGWIAASPDALRGVAAVRQDLGVSQLVAHAMDIYLLDGKLDERFEMLRPAYAHKRDIAFHALEKHCAELVRYNVPTGGLYFWLEIDASIDCTQVSCTLAAEGVACRPGERFTGDPRGRQFLRVSYLQVDELQIEHGIAALGRALEVSRSA